MTVQSSYADFEGDVRSSWFGNLAIVEFIRELFNYREYLKQSVLRDLKNRYKRSILGYFWTMLHPLSMMLILTVVFSSIMKIPVKDYALFLFAGMLPWNYFNQTCMMSLQTIRQNAKLFGQVPVPKYIFVVSIATSNFVNYLLALIPLLALTVFLQAPLHPTILAFPVIILPWVLMSLGIALILAVSNVFFDDTLHLAEVGLQALYYMSPILYSRAVLSPELADALQWNPLFVQVEFIRGIFYEGTLPTPEAYLTSLGIGLATLLFGLWVFRRNDHKFLYFI